MEEDHDRGDGDKGEAEVDQREEDFFQGEDHLLDADLLEEGGRVDDRGHGGGGGVAHDAEQGVSQDEVERVVLDAGKAQEKAEHCRQDAHHEQGVEHRPHDAQDAAAVFQLEVARDERREREPVSIERFLRSASECHGKHLRAIFRDNSIQTILAQPVCRRSKRRAFPGKVQRVGGRNSCAVFGKIAIDRRAGTGNSEMRKAENG